MAIQVRAGSSPLRAPMKPKKQAKLKRRHEEKGGRDGERGEGGEANFEVASTRAEGARGRGRRGAALVER